MWCEWCEANQPTRSGVCETCGADLLGYGQAAVLDPWDTITPCVVCKVGDAAGTADVCDDCYTWISECDPDDFPEICPACCERILTAGRTWCEDCAAYVEDAPRTSKRPALDWWGEDDLWDLPIPAVADELETIPAIRKV